MSTKVKGLTKALKGTIKRLESKGVTQLIEMATDKLNKDLKELNKCYDYDMTDEQNEIVEVLIMDINKVLTDRLTDSIVLVADKKEAPKKGKKTTDKKDKPTAPKKDKKDTKKDKKETKQITLEEANKEVQKEIEADKKKNTKKNTKTADKPKTPPKKKGLKEVLKWKSLIKMTLEDNIHYCYIVDIEADFNDVLARSTDDNSLVFQFDTKALDSATYTDPTGDKWTLEYTGRELK